MIFAKGGSFYPPPSRIVLRLTQALDQLFNFLKQNATSVITYFSLLVSKLCFVLSLTLFLPWGGGGGGGGVITFLSLSITTNAMVLNFLDFSFISISYIFP